MTVDPVEAGDGGASDALEFEIIEFADVEEAYAESQQALESQRSGHPPPTGDDDSAVEPRGVGVVGEDRVRAVVGPGGRVESVTLDPRALRGGPEDVGAQLTEALNAALDDLRTNVGEQETPEVDLDAIDKSLAEAQEIAVERMSEFASGVDDALVRIEQHARQEG